MNYEWRTELVRTKGNILCPLCGKPFLHWDFQTITPDMCQHDVTDLFKAYYMAVNTLGEISLLEGSAHNMIRKAHDTLMEIEKI